MKKSFLTAALIACGVIPGIAQENGKAEFDPESAKPAKLTDSPLSVIDRLIAVDQDMLKKGAKIQWKEIYREVSNDFSALDDLGDAQACVLIGFKMTDGTLALKAKDAEEVKRCVESIEKLATGLKVPEDGLSRATQVKSAVERNNWADVFMQLSMMQKEIGNQLESLHQNDRSRGVLMVCGAWMQAVRVSYVLLTDEQMDKSSTNYLRAPLIAQLMRTELENITDPELRNSAQVKELKAMMPKIQKIVTIDRNPNVPEGQISDENMARLRQFADEFLAHQL